LATSAARLPSPPPSTKMVVLTLIASGSVSDYLDTSSLQQSVAAAAGVDKSLVTIKVAAASVIITASIAVPASTTAAAVQASLSSKLATVEAASTVLGVTVESVPTVAMSPVAASVDVGDNEKAMSGDDGNSTILLVVAICLFVLTGGIALLMCWQCRRKARQNTVATASAVTMGVQVEVDERGRPMAPRAQIVTAVDVPMVPPQDQVLAVQGVPLRTTAGDAVLVPAASPRPPLAASSADDAFPL